MVTLMPCNYMNMQPVRCPSLMDVLFEPKVKRARLDSLPESIERDRLLVENTCSTHSGNSSSSTCSSPSAPITGLPSTSNTGLNSSAAPLVSTPPSCSSRSGVSSSDFPAAADTTSGGGLTWPPLVTVECANGPIKSEVGSPGLQHEPENFTHDPLSFYSCTAASDLPNIYDKEYTKEYQLQASTAATYSSAQQYYSSMQQMYNASNAAAASSYINHCPSTAFHNSARYSPYPASLASSRGLSASCKNNANYISSSYASTVSPFTSCPGQAPGSYPPYPPAYGSSSSSSFVQNCLSSSQSIDYSTYATPYVDSQSAQYYYPAQSYTAYASSPSSSGSLSTNAYQLASSIPESPNGALHFTDGGTSILKTEPTRKSRSSTSSQVAVDARNSKGRGRRPNVVSPSTSILHI